MVEVEKEARPINCWAVCVHYSECVPFVNLVICTKIKLWDYIAESVEHAGYQRVEPVQLEVLSPEEIDKVYMEAEIPRAGYVENCKAIMRATVKATNKHNSKEQLYRKPSGGDQNGY